MTEFRRHFCDSVIERQKRLGIPLEAHVTDDLLRITLKLPSAAFNHRRKIDDWMFDCSLTAIVKTSGHLQLPLFRGVDRASLERVLQNGIDVVPTDMHWYGADLEKALEYGGDYPHILIIDGALAQRTFRTVAADAPSREHRYARKWSGAAPISTSNGARHHYSPLPVGDSRRGSNYEIAHAWFIPGDPFEALLGIIECRAGEDAS